MRMIIILAVSLGLASSALAGDAGETTLTVKQGEPGSLHPSIVNEGRAAIDRAAKWLLARQNADGYWSNEDFPALTALPLWALVQSGTVPQEAIDQAVKFILSCVREDGSIWREPGVRQKGGGLSNYNTAICMIALHAVGRPELVPVVQKARRFIAGTQHLGADEYRGGMGYDPETGRPYADLSNTYISYEAMRMTERVEDLRRDTGGKADLNWQAAQEFLARIQNPSTDTNDDHRGGFYYHPGESKAGTTTTDSGAVRFRSYGSMTYAGLLSLIYAEVDRRDPRVQSAFDWAERHWTLDENPGMGAEGLYYFYNVLSKALAVYGQDLVVPTGASPVNWKSELIRRLVNLQKTDPEGGTGYWVNDAGRWWEADPVLATSYSLLALEIALR